MQDAIEAIEHLTLEKLGKFLKKTKVRIKEKERD
jgi:hypothetical protein